MSINRILGIRLWLLAGVLLFLALASAPAAQAGSYYCGNARDPGYGVKADIGTPYSRPTVYDWVLSWVSTEGPSWLQTGWAIQPGWSYPKSYVESYISGRRTLDWYTDQAYNYARAYEVTLANTPSQNQWIAYVQGTSRGTFGPISAPREMQALSEMQGDTRSQGKGTFNNVKYRGQYQ